LAMDGKRIPASVSRQTNMLPRVIIRYGLVIARRPYSAGG
jgi:hypothetical protein